MTRRRATDPGLPDGPPSRSREEFLARVKALRGKPVNWLEPRAVIACVVSTVNAPRRNQIDAVALAAALRDGNVELPQVDSFFLETDVDAQRIFAAELGVPQEALLRAAEAYTALSGYDVPLLSTR